MLFSSPSFIFGFLPIFLLGYFLLPSTSRNFYILIASLIFYFIEGGASLVVFIASIIFNFYFALLINKSSGNLNKFLLVIGISVNLLPLFFYKYWMFFLQSTNELSTSFNLNIHYNVPQVVLLAGISFYTFHAISYLLDVNSKKVKPSISLINFGMYMANFPQLIAGPIVRYAEILNKIEVRTLNYSNIYSGLALFIVGLAQKVIFADSAGVIADGIFALPASEISLGQAWLGAFTYGIQIYFDFSGYSNMAIGLGRVMGFDFPQNFNQPYRSHSITEFWRRWHMTLSRWFRDYVYIPLGGNKKSKSRTLTNLLIVFFLCGIWHGASYTFIIWGLYHGTLLIFEKILFSQFKLKAVPVLSQILTFILVLIGWVIFRSESLEQSFEFIEAMFGFSHTVTSLASFSAFLRADLLIYIALGALVSIFPFEYLKEFMRTNPMIDLFKFIGIVFLLIVVSSFIASNGFNPFIYFKF